MVIRLLVLLALGGVALGYFGVREFTRASGIAGEPRTMTVAELAANGPGDNRHVRLTDARALPSAAPLISNSTNEWIRAWTGVIPRDDAPEESGRSGPLNTPPGLAGAAAIDARPRDQTSPSGEFRVVLDIKNLDGEEQFNELVEQTEFTGYVVEASRAVGELDLRYIEQSNRGVDIASSWFLVTNDRVPSSTLGIAMIAGGVVLVGVGIGGITLRARAGRSSPDAPASA